MRIYKNVALKKYNTFGIAAKAAYWTRVNKVADLERLQNESIEKMILGGGSNMLLISDVDKLVVKNDFKGVELLKENKNSIYLKVGGGENWHEFVCWCLEEEYGGIENLSLIPGTVGAAPIQNIGAYGVELKDVFQSLEAFNLKTGKVESFNLEACKFGYRDSVFKNTLKGQYCILSVVFRLTKNKHQFHTNYGAIQTALKKAHVEKISIKAISDAVVSIRQSKLPDPKKLGNSGSFFKNPVISKSAFKHLEKAYPKVPSYPLEDGRVKVPAGWLIEQAGWKGKRVGNTGAHAKQALVLVNYGGATGQEIYALALKIKASVKQKFSINIEPEVNLIGKA